MVSGICAPVTTLRFDTVITHTHTHTHTQSVAILAQGCIGFERTRGCGFCFAGGLGGRRIISHPQASIFAFVCANIVAGSHFLPCCITGLSHHLWQYFRGYWSEPCLRFIYYLVVPGQPCHRPHQYWCALLILWYCYELPLVFAAQFYLPALGLVALCLTSLPPRRAKFRWKNFSGHSG